jgi:hypothetical protein
MLLGAFFYFEGAADELLLRDYSDLLFVDFEFSLIRRVIPLLLPWKRYPRQLYKANYAFSLLV